MSQLSTSSDPLPGDGRAGPSPGLQLTCYLFSTNRCTVKLPPTRDSPPRTRRTEGWVQEHTLEVRHAHCTCPRPGCTRAALMSAQATDYVWTNSPFKGTAKLIHLAIAEVVNDAHQWRYWGGDSALAAKVGCDRMTVVRWKAKAIDQGYLTEHGFDPQTGNKQYLFLMPGSMRQDVSSPGHGGSCGPPVDKPMRLPVTPMRHPRESHETSTTFTPITNQTEPKEPNARETRDSSRVEVPTLTLVHRDPDALVTTVVTFADCWAIYPRKLNRAGAEKAFAARVKSGVLIADLMTATQHFADSMRQEHREQAVVMHGSTFYGANDRYLDYLDGPVVERRQGGQAGRNQTGWDTLRRLAGEGLSP